MRTLLAILLSFTFYQQAYAYSCGSSCSSQCKQGWIGNNVEPVCFSACKADQLMHCYNVSDPYVTTAGEIGAWAYQAAAATTSERNVGRGLRRLSHEEKDLLRPIHGDLVDSVVLHTGAHLMGEWGGGAFKIVLSADYGQTYGMDIYLSDAWIQLSPSQKITVIAHEMCHSRQFQVRGSSFPRFGRDYFEGYAGSGGYENNPMEQECQAVEAQAEKDATAFYAMHDRLRRPWDFQVCNQSEFDTVYVAFAFTHFLEGGGFSLVANPYAKGWYAVAKGQCSTLYRGISPDDAIYAMATAGADGNWASWTTKAGQRFCVDSINAFTIQGSDHRSCNQQRDWEINGFYAFSTPWGSGQGVETWTLGGGHTRLHVCNNSGRKIDSAMLRGDGGWHSIGWYTFDVGQCLDFSFGAYEGPTYIYGKAADGSGFEWISADEPKFCVFPGQAFDHDHGDECHGTFDVVPGYKVDLQHGLHNWSFAP